MYPSNMMDFPSLPKLSQTGLALLSLRHAIQENSSQLALGDQTLVLWVIDTSVMQLGMIPSGNLTLVNGG